MGMLTSLRGVRLLVAALLVATPTTALAHVLMTSPPPRSDADFLKPPTYPGPCGKVPRTTKFVQYASGATIDVTFKETIDHAGCYQVAFSEANDQNFKVLNQMVDPGGTKGQVFTMKVKLPDGVTCEACTLQLRQQMSGTAACPADMNAAPIQSTYYSCADIRVGDFPDAAASDDAGTDPETDAGDGSEEPRTDGSDGTDGGDDDTGAGTGTPSGSRRLPRAGNDDGGGCSVAVGATGGFSLFAASGLGVLALVRRRRRRGGRGL